MKSYNTAQRLKQVMTARNMRQVDVLAAAKPFCDRYGVKLGKNDLSQYVSGKVEPRQDKLTILGLALGVSEAWLMGYDVTMERNVTPTAEVGDGRTSEFVDLFQLLNADQQALIIHAIKGLLSER
ncbi:MAG: transcriptional regulator [Roseburia sp.]|nr:transcriptional regulator [Roseburia sp.]